MFCRILSSQDLILKVCELHFHEFKTFLASFECEIVMFT